MFPREQLLIQRSEDFFREPQDVLRKVHSFLGLPPLDCQELPALNQGSYKAPMNPETRARLREYFRPHNERLYDLLSTDFGWDRSPEKSRSPKLPKRAVAEWP
jgi:hypothetical protein